MNGEISSIFKRLHSIFIHAYCPIINPSTIRDSVFSSLRHYYCRLLNKALFRYLSSERDLFRRLLTSSRRCNTAFRGIVKSLASIGTFCTYGTARRQPLVIFIKRVFVASARGSARRLISGRPRLILQRAETRNPE